MKDCKRKFLIGGISAIAVACCVCLCVIGFNKPLGTDNSAVVESSNESSAVVESSNESSAVVESSNGQEGVTSQQSSASLTEDNTVNVETQGIGSATNTASSKEADNYKLGQDKSSNVVEPKKAIVPVPKKDLVYNKEALLGVEAGEGYSLTGYEDPTKCIILPDTIDNYGAHATNACRYGVRAILDDGYVWSDGSTEKTKDLFFEIAKAPSNLRYYGDELIEMGVTEKLPIRFYLDGDHERLSIGGESSFVRTTEPPVREGDHFTVILHALNEGFVGLWFYVEENDNYLRGDCYMRVKVVGKKLTNIVEFNPATDSITSKSGVETTKPFQFATATNGSPRYSIVSQFTEKGGLIDYFRIFDSDPWTKPKLTCTDQAPADKYVIKIRATVPEDGKYTEGKTGSEEYPDLTIIWTVYNKYPNEVDFDNVQPINTGSYVGKDVTRNLTIATSQTPVKYRFIDAVPYYFTINDESKPELTCSGDASEYKYEIIIQAYTDGDEDYEAAETGTPEHPNLIVNWTVTKETNVAYIDFSELNGSLQSGETHTFSNAGVDVTAVGHLELGQGSATFGETTYNKYLYLNQSGNEGATKFFLKVPDGKKIKTLTVNAYVQKKETARSASAFANCYINNGETEGCGETKVPFELNKNTSLKIVGDTIRTSGQSGINAWGTNTNKEYGFFPQITNCSSFQIYGMIVELENA